jgi:hypothetical protein
MSKESVVPEDMLRAIERELENSKESLDEFFWRAAEKLLAYRLEQEMINQY